MSEYVYGIREYQDRLDYENRFTFNYLCKIQEHASMLVDDLRSEADMNPGRLATRIKMLINIFEENTKMENTPRKLVPPKD